MIIAPRSQQWQNLLLSLLAQGSKNVNDFDYLQKGFFKLEKQIYLK